MNDEDQLALLLSAYQFLQMEIDELDNLASIVLLIASEEITE